MWARLKRMFAAATTEPMAVHLKGKTEASLAKDLKALMPGQVGWITVAEAGRLFSAKEEDALSERDPDGIAALGRFATDPDHRSLLTRNFSERRIYFTRS